MDLSTRTPLTISSLILLLSLASPFVLTASDATQSKEAIPVNLHLLLDSGEDESKQQGVAIHLIRPGAGSEDSAETIEISASVPGRVNVEIPPGDWTVKVKSDSLWLSDRHWGVDSKNRRFSLMLRNAGWVEARVEPPGGEEPPSSLEMTVVRSAVRDTAEPATNRCPVVDRRIRCKVPAYTADLKLSAEGYAPQYFWDVDIKADESVSLGAVELHAGGSVSGWVHTPWTEPAPSQPPTIRVEIGPEVPGIHRDPSLGQRVAAMRMERELEDNGFFQLTGLAEGIYRLNVLSPQHSLHQVGPIMIHSGEEIELDPIELAPLSEAHFLLDPPKDPYHQPWHLELLHRVPGSGLEFAEEGEASDDGRWTVTGLDRGAYKLRVRDSRRSEWLLKNFEVDQARIEQELDLPLTRLEVRVQWDDEPLSEANVQVSNLKLGAKTARRTNEEGAAYFFLPRGNLWTIVVSDSSQGLRSEFRDIEVPDVRAGERWPILDLEIPDTSLEGVVLDPDGQGVKAVVNVAFAEQPVESLPLQFSMFSTEEGEFELKGVKPGRVNLQARMRDDSAGLLRSNRLTVQLEENQPVRVEMQLEPIQVVSGQVVAPSGNPVPGAFVFAFAELRDGTADLLNEEAYTDIDGTFEFSVRESARALQLSVYPPGFAASQQRVLLPTDRPVIVPVETTNGTLVLEWDRTDEAIENPLLTGSLNRATVLIRESLVGVGGVLHKWSEMNQVPGEPGRLVMPMMPPGNYTACFGKQAEYSAKRGDFTPYGLGELCTSGFLGAGQELRLTIPTD